MAEAATLLIITCCNWVSILYDNFRGPVQVDKLLVILLSAQEILASDRPGGGGGQAVASMPTDQSGDRSSQNNPNNLVKPTTSAMAKGQIEKVEQRTHKLLVDIFNHSSKTSRKP